MDDKRIPPEQGEQRSLAEVIHTISEAATAGATVYGAIKLGRPGGGGDKPKDK